MSKEQQATDQLYKSHFGKMVTAMLRFSSEIDVETAEDLVQDAFVAALSSWAQNEVPVNPAGWIYRVCRNNAINILKRKKSFDDPFNQYQETGNAREETCNIFSDDKTQLLFACAHPKLSAKMQIVITLKYVINLKTASIAKVLAMTTDGIDKILARARQRIKLENVFLKPLTPQQLRARLPIVHQVIYLLFNEGYKANSGAMIIREELCEESLIITKILLDTPVANTDTKALYSLMLLNAARLKARINLYGELTDLEQQDRGQWNKDLISLGNYYFHQSRCDNASSYHYEAAIAYLHCQSKSFAETDWATITQLYSNLSKKNSNPFIELNYAIALYYSDQKQKAFAKLNALCSTFLERSYLLHAALGKLYWQEGRYDKSDLHLSTAFSLANFEVEKEYVKKMMVKI